MINKEYFNKIIDIFEQEVYEVTKNDFNKRSSVTKEGGRPYSYSPGEIGEQMVKYFRDCIENDRPFMVSGICWALGISRTTLFNLERSQHQAFVNIIKKGKQIVELYLEIQVHLKLNPRFPLFVLSNMGWKEKKSIKTRPMIEVSNKERTEALKRISNFSE